MDVPVAGLALHCGSTMLIVRSCEQLCGTECHLQYLDSGQWHSGSFFAAGNKKTISSWGWYLAGGIIDLLIGIYLVFYPLVSMELIPFIVAFWLMFRGFTLCGYSTDLKRYGTKDWGWYLVFGILAILCSMAIIWQPGLGAVTVLYMLSITFLIIGCFRVIFSFELKRLHKNK